jgi:hypothetical protein
MRVVSDTRPFYLKDIGILEFAYPWGILESTPVPTKGQLWLEQIEGDFRETMLLVYFKTSDSQRFMEPTCGA